MKTIWRSQWSIVVLLLLTTIHEVPAEAFLSLRPAVREMIPGEVLEHNPFWLEENLIEGNISPQKKQDSDEREWQKSLKEVEWRAVLLPVGDFTGVVVVEDRIIRMGDYWQWQDRKMRLMGIQDNELLWETEDRESVAVPLEPFHRRRYVK